jgi:hypothetical protein
MIDDAVAAFAQIFTPPFRATLLKSLALTIGLLILVWFALDRLAATFINGATPWLATILSWLVGLGLFVGLAFLVAPVVSLVACNRRARNRPRRTAGQTRIGWRRRNFRPAFRRPVDPRQSVRSRAAFRAGRQCRRVPGS